MVPGASDVVAESANVPRPDHRPDPDLEFVRLGLHFGGKRFGPPDVPQVGIRNPLWSAHRHEIHAAAFLHVASDLFALFADDAKSPFHIEGLGPLGLQLGPLFFQQFDILPEARRVSLAFGARRLLARFVFVQPAGCRSTGDVDHYLGLAEHAAGEEVRREAEVALDEFQVQLRRRYELGVRHGGEAEKQKGDHVPVHRLHSYRGGCDALYSTIPASEPNGTFTQQFGNI